VLSTARLGREGGKINIALCLFFCLCLAHADPLFQLCVTQRNDFQMGGGGEIYKFTPLLVEKLSLYRPRQVVRALGG